MLTIRKASSGDVLDAWDIQCRKSPRSRKCCVPPSVTRPLMRRSGAAKLVRRRFTSAKKVELLARRAQRTGTYGALTLSYGTGIIAPAATADALDRVAAKSG